jgi:hypothetical protein
LKITAKLEDDQALMDLRLEKIEITLADEDYAGSDATWYASLYLDGYVVTCTTNDLE